MHPTRESLLALDLAEHIIWGPKQSESHLESSLEYGI